MNPWGQLWALRFLFVSSVLVEIIIPSHSSSKLDSRFIAWARYLSKPWKLKELPEIGGGCANVCMARCTMVIYNSRHVNLEMSTNMENIVITSSSSCIMHAMYLPQSPTNDTGNWKWISFTTSPFGRLMLFPIAYFKAFNDIMLSSWTIFGELFTNVESCLVVMIMPS